ncbi:SpoU rRNA Methylase family, putative [Leishmania donovani]|uniref:SpoU rRNA Methylase family, putative n=1 Tax=Leishmania donovani TaxID=5661 RepID=A0A3Q8IBF1_LEIDO|nr:SpoU rRNA Methylase family, putative [Leishmania donovani]
MIALSHCCLRYVPRRPPAFGKVVGGGTRLRRTSAPAPRQRNQETAADAETVAEAEVVAAFTSTLEDAKLAAADIPHRAQTSPPHLQPHRAAVYKSLPPHLRFRALSKPVVLEDVQDTYAITPTQEVHGQQLWTATKVLRSSKHIRKANATCVVGGASAIRRIWRTYNIRPNVVYVPNTDSGVPTWCLEEELPTVIVRCSPVAVRRHLLSAEYSDGYAAEFPLPVNCVTDATALLAPPPEPAQSEAAVPSTGDTSSSLSAKLSATGPPVARPLHDPFGHHAVGAMLVLVGLRIPSNVGTLLRAAADMGYDAAVLVSCADPTQEKVLRASDGTALSPTLRIYETETTEQACVSLLSSIAAQHHLMPFLAVPSQEVESAFEVAKRFHVYNAKSKEAATSQVSGGAVAGHSDGLCAAPTKQLGAMVILGSEAQGLRGLNGRWGVPYQLVTLPLSNPMVDSFNVSVAGSVLMHLFRPSAASHFTRLVALSGEAVGDLLPPPVTDDDDDESDHHAETDEAEASPL